MMPTQNDGYTAHGEDRDTAYDVIGRFVPLDRGQRGQRDGEEHREERRGHEQRRRGAGPGGDERGGGKLEEERIAEVAVEQATHVQQVLRQQGFVEAPGMVQFGHQLQASPGGRGVLRLGLPGTRWIMKNVRMVTPRIVGTASRTLLMMYDAMFTASRARRRAELGFMTPRAAVAHFVGHTLRGACCREA